MTAAAHQRSVPSLVSGSLKVDPISRQIGNKIPVRVADVRVHVDVIDILSVCQSTDDVIPLADHSVVPAVVRAALFIRDA